jgi:hypothetical protein
MTKAKPIFFTIPPSSEEKPCWIYNLNLTQFGVEFCATNSGWVNLEFSHSEVPDTVTAMYIEEGDIVIRHLPEYFTKRKLSNKSEYVCTPKQKKQSNKSAADFVDSYDNRVENLFSNTGFLMKVLCDNNLRGFKSIPPNLRRNVFESVVSMKHSTIVRDSLNSTPGRTDRSLLRQIDRLLKDPDIQERLKLALRAATVDYALKQATAAWGGGVQIKEVTTKNRYSSSLSNEQLDKVEEYMQTLSKENELRLHDFAVVDDINAKIEAMCKHFWRENTQAIINGKAGKRRTKRDIESVQADTRNKFPAKVYPINIDDIREIFANVWFYALDNNTALTTNPYVDKFVSMFIYAGTHRQFTDFLACGVRDLLSGRCYWATEIHSLDQHLNKLGFKNLSKDNEDRQAFITMLNETIIETFEQNATLDAFGVWDYLTVQIAGNLLLVFNSGDYRILAWESMKEGDASKYHLGQHVDVKHM